MKLFLIIYLFLFFLIFGCSSDTEYSKYFNSKNLSKREIIIDKLLIDTLNFKEIESSYIGFTNVSEKSIHFIDKRFCWIFTFDPEGNFISKRLGIGRGPEEIDLGYIEGYIPLPNGDHLFMGSSWNAQIFNSNWQRKKHLTINWQSKVKDIDAIENPDPKEPLLYTFDYENFILKVNNLNLAYVPIYSQHRNFNGFNSTNYYFKGRILAEINLNDGKVTRLLGRRSPEYLKYKYIGHHSYFSYEVSKNNDFYISQEIDSLIYRYDVDFKLYYTFGNKGKNMNTAYEEYAGLDVRQIRNLYFNDRSKKGYYDKICLIEGENLFFRNYTKGSQCIYDGLQIYKGTTLIADVEVPKKLSVAGFIEPYYYSNIIADDVTMTMKLYRFKLDIR